MCHGGCVEVREQLEFALSSHYVGPRMKLGFICDFITELSHQPLVRQFLIWKEEESKHMCRFFPVMSFIDKCR